ncbi:MAG: DUF21 domain-containing protein [Kiritimatiellae bacterium]|nr:DUF21 domain-containing protein [Kiritimatiellia bacterium]
MSEFVRIVLFCICVMATGFFAGMETGVISIGRVRLLHKARSGSRGASILDGYLRDPDRLLATTLVGCNLLGVVVSALSSEILASLSGSQRPVVAAIAASLALLFFGEFLPKAWFGSRPLERCVPHARTLAFFERLFAPLAWPLLKLTSWTGGSEARSHGVLMTRENLRLLANDSQRRGQISPLENMMIGRVLSLQTRTAAEIMTPMGRASTIRRDATMGDVAALARKTGHMRFPVMADDGTRCLGILHVADILAHITDDPQAPISSRIRPAFHVKAAMRADDVLPLMRRRRERMAIVRDKSGAPLGIVTSSSILDRIVRGG